MIILMASFNAEFMPLKGSDCRIQRYPPGIAGPAEVGETERRCISTITPKWYVSNTSTGVIGIPCMSYSTLFFSDVDEPDEVEFVKKALAEHLDLDPQVTLGVLCDQVVPADEPMDEEEQEIRDRLRSLVIAFLTGRAKRAIVDRHTSKPGNEAEQVLVGGLLTVRRSYFTASMF
jgi:hypothetical protein